MYIKYAQPTINLTDEEECILRQAREILLAFEDESSCQDENVLQEKYDKYTSCIEHQRALPTAIDLLTVIVGDTDL